MDLYLVRHADAVPVGEAGISEDASRPLTAKGEQQARDLAAALHRGGIPLDAIVTSPLLRARQTAEVIGKEWADRAPQIHVCEELAPGGKRRRLARFLEQLAAQKVALVGHQPALDEWAAWLIGGKKAQINLAKASVAYIACDQKADKAEGTLMWLVTQEWLGE